MCIFSGLPGSTMSTQCAHEWAGGEVVSSIFDPAVAPCALYGVRLVLVLIVLVPILIKLTVQLTPQRTRKTITPNIVVLASQLMNFSSAMEVSH